MSLFIYTEDAFSLSVGVPTDRVCGALLLVSMGKL
jgi:hypothetical protein